MPADSSDVEKKREEISAAFREAIEFAHTKLSAKGLALLEQLFDGPTGREELAEYVIWWARATYRDPHISELSAQIQALDNSLHDEPQPYAVHTSFVRECWLSSTLRGEPVRSLARQREATQHRLDWLERIQDRIAREIFALKSILNYLDSPMISPPKHLRRRGLSHALGGATRPRGEDSLRGFVVGLRQHLGLTRAAIYELSKALQFTRKSREAFNDNYKSWKPASAESNVELPAQFVNLAERARANSDRPGKLSDAERKALLAEEIRKAQQPPDRRMVIRFEPIGLRTFMYPPPPQPPDKPIEDGFDPEVHRECDLIAHRAKMHKKH